MCSFWQLLKEGSIEQYVREVDKRREAKDWEDADSGFRRATSIDGNGGGSPTANVLRLLRAAGSKGCVSKEQFIDAGVPEYRGVIGRLRKRGFGIASWQRQNRRGYRGSWYRLIFDLRRAKNGKKSKAQKG